MKANKVIRYIFLTIIAGSLIVSCDKVEEPFTKKIEVDTTSVLRQKRVLLEDYTGHQCPNCPEAAKMASNLKSNFGNKLVVLAVHAGWFSNVTPTGDFTNDYRTDAGTEWNTTFGIQAYPNGLVDRRNFLSAQHILSYPAWNEAITTALMEPVKVDLTITNNYETSTQELSTSVKLDFLESVDKNLMLIVVISEDGIVSPQKNSNAATGTTPVILDYEHNHMLRDAITDSWGTSVATAGTANPATLTKSFNHIISPNCVVANCSVVAFICDAQTKEVLQVAEKPIL